MDEMASSFARVAVRNKLMTEEQAQECLEECADGKLMVLVVVEKGFMSAANAERVQQALEKRISARMPAVNSGETSTPTPVPAPVQVAAKAVHAAPAAAAAPAEGGNAGHDAPPAQHFTVTKEMESFIAQGPDWSSLVGKSVNAYLDSARAYKASDIHLNAGCPPAIRVNGVLTYVKHPLLTADDTERLVKNMLTEEQFKRLHEHFELDLCHITKQGFRYRASVFKQRLGYVIISRVVPDKIMSLGELGLPECIARFTEYHQGLVLVTGPAGSGKTATLGALVDLINENRNDHIIFMEEPIELVHSSKKALVSQREIGPNTDSFSSALRAALREDPDIIVVGEMRDLETISLAITAAETGHLVIGTLHTRNAAQTVDRILDVFPPEEQQQIRAMLSESLRGIICQQLIPRADGKGRALALELLFMTQAVRKLIFDGRTFQMRSVLQTGKAQGMRLMDESIADLARARIVARDEALARMDDEKALAGEGS